MKKLHFCAVLLALRAATAGAQTTNFTWISPVSVNFGTAANWSVDVPAPGTPNPQSLGPGSDLSGLFDVLNFQANLASQFTVDLANAKYVQGIQFNPSIGTNSFIFTATEMTAGQSAYGFNLGPGGIVNNTLQTQGFDTPFTLMDGAGGTALGASNVVTINAASGGLNFTGNFGQAAGFNTVPTFDLSGGTLVFTGAATTTVGSSTNAGIISSTGGGGVVSQTGTGTLTLGGTNANTFSALMVNSGTVVAAKDQALGSSSAAITVNGGTLKLGTFNQTAGAFFLQNGTLNGSSGVLSANTFYLQQGTVGGILGGSGFVVKDTSGSVLVTSANTYSGGTFINAGKLVLGSFVGSATGSGSVLVNGGTTLAGDGIAAGKVSVNPGGVIDAGNGTANGILKFGQLNLQGGAIMALNMNKASGQPGGSGGGGTSFYSVINGALNLLGGSQNPVIISLTSLTLGNKPGSVADFDSSKAYDWLFVKTSAGITGLTSGDVVVNTANFQNSYNGTFGVQVEGNNLDVTYTPVPEPSELALGVLAGSGLLAARLRRARK